MQSYQSSNNIRQGVKSMIILKTDQNFLKTKFFSQQPNFLQKIAQWQMNRLIDIYVIKLYGLNSKHY